MRADGYGERAEAALHGAVAHERVLQRVEPAVALEPAQRDDRAPAHAGRQHETARGRTPVEQDRAHAAHALVAPLLDVEDPERVAQHLEQGLARAHPDLARPAVEDPPPGHRASAPSDWIARATARASARRPSTTASRRRYGPDANASDGGSRRSRAISAAPASTAAVGSWPRSASSAAAARPGRSATPPSARRASATRPPPATRTGATHDTRPKAPAPRP